MNDVNTVTSYYGVALDCCSDCCEGIGINDFSTQKHEIDASHARIAELEQENEKLKAHIKNCAMCQCEAKLEKDGE